MHADAEFCQNRLAIPSTLRNTASYPLNGHCLDFAIGTTDLGLVAALALDGSQRRSSAARVLGVGLV
jgi:hypothetical protein